MKSLIVLVLLLSFGARASGDYGKLLLETETPAESKRQIALTIGSEMDNAYFESQFITFSYQQRLNSYFDFNINLMGQLNEESETLKAFNQNQQLGASKLRATQLNGGLTIGTYFKPLFGQINFLSYKSLPFQIGPVASLGMAQIEDEFNTKNIFQMNFGVKGRFEISKRINLQVLIEENFRENMLGNAESFTRLQAGIGYHF